MDYRVNNGVFCRAPLPQGHTNFQEYGVANSTAQRASRPVLWTGQPARHNRPLCDLVQFANSASLTLKQQTWTKAQQWDRHSKSLHSVDGDIRNFKKSFCLYLSVCWTLSNIAYSSVPFAVLVDIELRSRVNARKACSALLLFHGTPS